MVCFESKLFHKGKWRSLYSDFTNLYRPGIDLDELSLSSTSLDGPANNAAVIGDMTVAQRT